MVHMVQNTHVRGAVWLDIYQSFEMEYSLWAQEQWLRMVYILLPTLHKIAKYLKRFHRRRRQAAIKREVVDLEAMD